MHIERGWAVTDLDADEQGVTVTARGGDGVTESIRCTWLIGCDGAHSAVRQAAGIPFEGATYANEFIMADAELDWDLPDGDIYAFPTQVRSTTRTARAGSTHPPPATAPAKPTCSSTENPRICTISSSVPSTPCCCSPHITDTAASVVELCRTADRIECAYPDLVSAHVISTQHIDHSTTVGDPQRCAHDRYGITRPTAFVVRPDLHIAYRATPITTDALLADLALRLPGAATARLQPDRVTLSGMQPQPAMEPDEDPELRTLLEET